MACDLASLSGYLGNFTGTRPVESVICPFAQSAGGGLGIGVPLFALLFFGPIGLAMSVRIQHPGPILVAGMLTIGAVAATLPGQASQIVAIVFFFAIVGLGLYLYQRAKTTL